MTRRAGLLIPLFSFPSSSSWGIGDIGDIAPMSAWLKDAGQSVLQLLPLNEMADGEQSPYSALSAMAIDPIYIRLPDVDEWVALGGEESLSGVDRAALDRVRRTSVVDYRSIRSLKLKALTAAFEQFFSQEWKRNTARASGLAVFVSQESWWLEDYALYRAIQHREEKRPWTDWPEPLRRRDARSLSRVRAELSREVLFFEYLQWLADEQWRAARVRAKTNGVALFGDLPFMVNLDSADVWIRRHQFRLDMSVGAPPDAFSATGQNWGVPAYDWDVMASDDFGWIRERARRGAALFEGYRVDHLVGFYRTYYRPHDGSPARFIPEEEDEQRALGERVLSVFTEPGSEIIAEDLGVVPDFVRASLARLSIAGYKVFRWERHWHTEGQPFTDPVEYPAVSVATSGTHDTEPMVIWWEEIPREEREAVLAIPSVRRLLTEEDLAAVDAPGLPHAIHEALLETLFAAGSNTLILPIGDIFGWRDRINQPATVGEGNWTWRLPWPSDRMSTEPAAMEVAKQLAEWCARHGRT